MNSNLPEDGRMDLENLGAPPELFGADFGLTGVPGCCSSSALRTLSHSQLIS